MTIEIKMLVFSSILGIVQLLMAAHAATMVRGVKWNLSMRETPVPELKGMPARLDRAYKNFMETFPFVVAAVLALQATGGGNEISALGAQVYFYARVVYVPMYAFGVKGGRTLIWGASLIGIAMILFPFFS